MRRFVLALLTLTLLAVSVPPGTAASDAGWGELFADSAGSSTSTLAGPDPAQVAWVSTIPNTRTDGRHEIFGTADVVQLTGAGGGLVLIRAGDTSGGAGIGAEVQRLYALRVADGSVAWTVDGMIDNCTPGVHGDLIWAVRRAGPDTEDWQLVTIDGAGTVEVRYTQPVWDGDDNVPLTACSAALRFLSDGSVVLLHSWGGVPGGTGQWLRVIRPNGTEMWREWVERPTGDRLLTDVRVGPVGAPNADVIYLFYRDQMGTGSDTDDVLTVVAVDPADGSVLADLEVPGSRWMPSGITMRADGALFAATEQFGAPDRPDLPDDVVGHISRVAHDGGATMTLVYSRPARHQTTDAGTLREGLQFLAVGDGDTLLGTYAGTRNGVVGLSATDGTKQWEMTQGIVTRPLVADAPGNAYVWESFRNGLISLAPDGRVRWAFHTFTELADLETLRVQAIGADRRLYLTAKERGTGFVTVVAMEQGRETVRAAGTTRLDTAVEVSRQAFPVDGITETAVIARADEYPDALSGAPLAYKLGGPLLLSESSRLSEATAAELTRLGVNRVILLGGTAALGDQVEADVRALGITSVERIRGANRFDTAGRVADAVGGTRVVVVEGANPDPARGWPDAVAASAYAASTGRPILLVTRDDIPEGASAAMARLSVDEVTVVGGRAAVSDEVLGQLGSLAGSPATRLSGPGRYATSVAVVRAHQAEGGSTDWVWLATGTAFADALAAGPAAAATGGLLLLVDGRNVAAGTESYEWLGEHRAEIGAVVLVGGTAAISEEVAARIATTLGR